MKKITIPELIKYKREGRKISMVTAYDHTFAEIVDESGVEGVLIGDSLGMVIQGKANTLNVSMDEMLYHTRIVARAVKKAVVIGDMPFMSFQPGVEDTIRNAGRFLQAGAEAVKIEGGVHLADRMLALSRLDIPVMGHIGLTPQSIHRMGGYKVQGRDKNMESRLMEDAKAVEEAGAFAIVLEGIPMNLSKKITRILSIPTIGIGGGRFCDGQILVLYDLLGLLKKPQPTFIRHFANFRSEAIKALGRFKEQVDRGSYPSDGESYR